MKYLHRISEIKSMIPEDTKKILEIGCQNSDSYFKNGKWETTTIDVIDADVLQNLNKNQKLPFYDNSFDLVMMTGILEHLVEVEVIIKESVRISKKYILISLPNEACINNRLKLLFGVVNRCSNYKIIPLEYGGRSYMPYGHKHQFDVRGTSEFVNWFYDGWDKKLNIFTAKGGRYIPIGLRNCMARIKPSLFAGEIIYLIKKDKEVLK